MIDWDPSSSQHVSFDCQIEGDDGEPQDKATKCHHGHYYCGLIILLSVNVHFKQDSVKRLTRKGCLHGRKYFFSRFENGKVERSIFQVPHGENNESVQTCSWCWRHPFWATKQNFQVSLFQGREKKKIDTVKLFLGMLNLSVKGILEL